MSPLIDLWPRRQKQKTRLEGGFLYGRGSARQYWNGDHNHSAEESVCVSHAVNLLPPEKRVKMHISLGISGHGGYRLFSCSP